MTGHLFHREDHLKGRIQVASVPHVRQSLIYQFSLTCLQFFLFLFPFIQQFLITNIVFFRYLFILSLNIIACFCEYSLILDSFFFLLLCCFQSLSFLTMSWYFIFLLPYLVRDQQFFCPCIVSQKTVSHIYFKYLLQKVLAQQVLLQTMSQDALLQKMVAEGLNKNDFVQKQDLFKGCPFCMTPFSPSECKPVLLSCGHVMCQECATQNQCFCAMCNTKRNIKLNPFNSLLVYYNLLTAASYGNQYNFSIVKKTGAGKGIVVEAVPGTITIGQLLSKSPDFIAFLNNTGPKTGIILNNKGIHYDAMKNTPIAEVKNANLVQSSSGNKRINEISFFNRELGGRN